VNGFGGTVTAVLSGGFQVAKRLPERVGIFALAGSLGGVKSLIKHPTIMTHAAVPAEARTRPGITDGLVRLSVGIEDAYDLIADLEQVPKPAMAPAPARSKRTATPVY